MKWMLFVFAIAAAAVLFGCICGGGQATPTPAPGTTATPITTATPAQTAPPSATATPGSGANACPRQIRGCCVIESAGSYALANDIAASSLINYSGPLNESVGPRRACIAVGALDEPATLDCGGHTITGPGKASGGAGIYAQGSSSFTVANCGVRNFSDGILLSYSSGLRVENSDASGNGASGIYLDMTNLSDIRGNTASSNTGYDMARGTGILIFGVGNSVWNNTANSNDADGFIIEGMDNSVTENKASMNGLGIRLPGMMAGGGNNTVSSNRLENNTYGGIFIGTGTNTLDGNYACGNGGLDMECLTAQLTNGDNTCGTKDCAGIACVPCPG